MKQYDLEFLDALKGLPIVRTKLIVICRAILKQTNNRQEFKALIAKETDAIMQQYQKQFSIESEEDLSLIKYCLISMFEFQFDASLAADKIRNTDYSKTIDKLSKLK